MVQYRNGIVEQGGANTPSSKQAKKKPKLLTYSQAVECSASSCGDGHDSRINNAVKYYSTVGTALIYFDDQVTILIIVVVIVIL